MTIWRIRISAVLPSLEGGGAEQVTVTVANALAERGHLVDLVVASAEGPNRVRVSNQVQIVNLNRAGMAQCIAPLSRYLRKERPDAILSVMTHANNITLLARLLAGEKGRLVISERVSVRWPPENAKELLHQRLRRLLYRCADGLVMVAKEEIPLAADWFRIPRERISAIYNPVITPEFERLRTERPAHPWLSAKLAEPVVVAVGRLEPQKDHALLIEAFSLLRSRRPARLVIFGEGSLRTALEAQIRNLRLDDCVDLPGFTGNPVAELAAADLFVLSSRNEGLPGALIQALGCGLPVVSTDCPTGPSEILQGGRHGWLVPMGSAQALAAAMDEALTKGAPPTATLRASHFSLDRAVEQYERLLLGIEAGEAGTVQSQKLK